MNDAPLSCAQARAWYRAWTEPGIPRDVHARAVRCDGVDVAAIERALDGLRARHDVLRTRFVGADGRPTRAVASEVRPFIVRSIAVDDDDALTRCLQEAIAIPWDLSGETLVRATRFTQGPLGAVLLVTAHALVADARSMDLVLEALRGVVHEAPRDADALHASSERAWIASPEGRAQLAAWCTTLAALPPPLDLPTDRPRPASRDGRAHTREHRIARGSLARLHALAAAHGVTPFVAHLSTLCVLLARSTASRDVLVAISLAGREQAGERDALGSFANDVALRVELTDDLHFTTLIARVARVLDAARSHGRVPFDAVLDALGIVPDASRAPVCQVTFALAEADSPDEIAVDAPLDHDLAWTLVPVDGTLAVRVRYADALFDAASIERLQVRYEALVASLSSRPDGAIFAAPMLSADERRTVVRAWNATAVDFGPYRALHTRFEDQAARTPDAIAVQSDDDALTYAALDRRANQLANALDVAPGTRVAVQMERSVALVVALLAVLKSGAAYVPLDPAYPAERLAYMLLDARPAVLITDAPDASTDVRTFVLDARAHGLDGQPTTTRTRHTPPEAAAYVIYTSGSTGRPKGVVNTHRAIVNRLDWMQSAYGLGADDVVLQKTPFSFDVSVWEFFWPLIVGARLFMARPGGHRDGGYLRDTVVRAGITTLHFVPSMLRTFLETPRLESCRSLRRVICSGEALSHETRQRFFARMPASLHNLYGPTEAAVDVTAWTCRRDDARAIVPIGSPIANVQCYVLDARMEPVGIGVPGELYLGGVALARGYHGRPGLTAERFVPDPFATTPGARSYRTGDAAAWLHDGTIAYRGRLDQQVKLRGFRIELGEVEAVLARDATVRDVVATVYAPRADDAMLVAYLVLADARADTIGRLRAAASETLPAYMVPSRFVVLDALPLSPSGKVDRRALPPPDANRATVHAPPRDEIEARVARIWCEVLGVAQVGIEDGFEARGGRAMQRVEMAARVSDAFGVHIAPARFVAMRTVAEIARWIVSERGEEAPARLIARPSREAALLARVDELDAAELDALMAEMEADDEAAP